MKMLVTFFLSLPITNDDRMCVVGRDCSCNHDHETSRKFTWLFRILRRPAVNILCLSSHMNNTNL